MQVDLLLCIGKVTTTESFRSHLFLCIVYIQVHNVSKLQGTSEDVFAN